ncbi:MAG: zf-HC2 domain-containing protein [Bryobacteraceae bacterium]|nr:zf-HC2 domain-containing protein [Bryobacteraceae bacterium]
MSCRKTRTKFGRYLDGELLPQERQSLEGHLAECLECAREVDVLRRIDDFLGEDAAPRPPDLSEAILRRVQSERAEERPWMWLQAAAASPWPMKLAATGAAALAVYMGLLIGGIGHERIPAGDTAWLVSASQSPIVTAYQGAPR